MESNKGTHKYKHHKGIVLKIHIDMHGYDYVREIFGIFGFNYCSMMDKVCISKRNE